MKIALLGFGTVGRSVYELCKKQPSLCIKTVMDLRELPIPEKVTKDISEITADAEIQTVVELIGGHSPAYEFISACLKAGKNVVTANKLVISRHFGELNALARENGVSLLYSASCGGAIPWLPNLSIAATVEPIDEVRGIMNGTTNYMLGRMTDEGLSFDECLSLAQKAGYAEADPSADIDGLDILRKCVISANTAFGGVLDETEVPVEGIRSLQSEDIAFFSEKGYRLKLIARACRTEQSVCAYVEPTVLPTSDLFANIPLNYNYLTYRSALCGIKGFYGEGAGGFPTAGAVIRDLLQIESGAPALRPATDNALRNDLSGAKHLYYVRTDSSEKVGNVLSENGVWRVLLTEMAPDEMKALAERIRQSGKTVFYAGFSDGVEL